MHDEAALDFFFSSRRRHTRLQGDWSSDVCSSDLCLTPGEGHGQGDSVIKDFLEAAYQKSDAAIYDNKKFFRKWTPGRIRVSSFGSAFVTREFVDRKSTRLNSSHLVISYAVFCLKKKS